MEVCTQKEKKETPEERAIAAAQKMLEMCDEIETEYIELVTGKHEAL